jgi:uncharacterized membrane protein YfcA
MFGLGYEELTLVSVGIQLAIIVAVRKYSKPVGEESELVGIRGWLLLVAITVCIVPLWLVPAAVQTLDQGDQVTLVVSTLLAFWSVINVVLFFRRKRVFPSSWIAFSVVAVIGVILSALVVESEPVVGVAGSVFSIGVWVVYMLRSRRVKATFVK